MLASFERNIEEFVGQQFRNFDRTRAAYMDQLELIPLLNQDNPYLTRVNYRESAHEVIKSLVDGGSASRHKGLFDDFLKSLAVFVAQEKYNGQKSSTTGINIDLQRDGIRYLIAVKSGESWSNSSSMKKLKENFQTAVRVLKQSKTVGEIQPTIGICYGRTKRLDNGLYLQVSGQDFWELISGEPDLYMDIIEPIGYKAREFNDQFIMKRDHALNRMVREFTEKFCTADGKIDWQKIVTHVSKTS